MRPIDADACPSLFDEAFKETEKLIEQGETHLNNLAEGFFEAHQVINRMPTIYQSEWISCAEMLPEREGTYLVRTERGSVYTRHFYTEHECANGYIRAACWSKAGKVAVTHWMPMPEYKEDE